MKAVHKIRCLFNALIIAMIFFDIMPAYGEAYETNTLMRSEIVNLLFRAVAGTTYEAETALRSGMDAKEQAERMSEAHLYREGTRNWLLAALGADIMTEPDDVLSWMPSMSFALFETTETGRAYIERMRQEGCTDAEDCLEWTRAVVGEWMAEIDHEMLSSMNDDYSFWLYGADSPIDYPVVQCEDNSRYLDRLFNGEKNACGTLFVDYRNLPSFADPNTLIYGHHMRNGSMFKSITYYNEAAYYTAHPYMLILSSEGIYLVEPIAGYTTDAKDHCYDIALSDTEDLLDFVLEAQDKSDFSVEIDPTEIERMVTLSTCDYTFNNARYIVICRLTSAVLRRV